MTTLTNFLTKTKKLTPEQKEHIIFAVMQFNEYPFRKWAEFFTITSYLLFDSAEKNDFHPKYAGKMASINLTRRLINVGRIAHLRKDDNNLLEAFKYRSDVIPLGFGSSIGTYSLAKTFDRVPKDKVKEYMTVIKEYDKLSLQDQKTFLSAIGSTQRLRKRTDLEPRRRCYTPY